MCAGFTATNANGEEDLIGLDIAKTSEEEEEEDDTQEDGEERDEEDILRRLTTLTHELIHKKTHLMRENKPQHTASTSNNTARGLPATHTGLKSADPEKLRSKTV
jgi:hypothetical protein